MTIIHCPERHPALLTAGCVAAIAPEWPHECSDPACPGMVNQRRLEAAEALAAAALAWMEGSPRISCPGCGAMHRDYHENSCACDHCALVLQTKKAIARYREVAKP